MLVHEITCPKCRSSMKSKAGIEAGKLIGCPKCQHKFKVAAPVDEADIVEDFETEDPPPRKKAPPPPKARANPVRRDDDDDERPSKSKKAARRRDDDDDDEEDAPRPRKKRKRARDDEEMSAYGKLKSNVLVRVITLGVLLTILAVLGYMLYEKRMAEKEANNAPVPNKSEYDD